MMENIKKFGPWIIIGILILIIFLMQTCRHCPQPIVTETHDTIPGDSIPYEVLIPKPYPVKEIIPADTFWRDMDTAAMYAACHKMALQFYTLRIYDDTLMNDTGALIRLVDTVFMNELHKRTLYFQNRRATAINNYYYSYGEPARWKVYLGISIKTDLKGFGLAPEIAVFDKGNCGYAYDFDLFNKTHSVTFLYKIHFRKRNPP